MVVIRLELKAEFCCVLIVQVHVRRQTLRLNERGATRHDAV